MAIGNPFNGQLRGRIGGTVFSRKNGKQHSRAYAESVSNPRTQSQSGQRVKFATCAEFYSRAVKNLFKFAYEDQRKDESDYNAFMRHNLKSVPAQTKTAINEGQPMIGNWTLSKGSLSPAILQYSTGASATYGCRLMCGSGEAAIQGDTVGALSKALAKFYGLEQGDIVTVVIISSPAEPCPSLAEAEGEGSLCRFAYGDDAQWEISQMRIDFDNDDTISADGIFETITGSKRFVNIVGSTAGISGNVEGCAVIFSRPTKKGLKVSTAQIVANLVTSDAIQVGLSEEWWRFAANHFYDGVSLDNEPEAILQGSLLEE